MSEPMRILITGAGGFVGPWLIKSLAFTSSADVRILAASGQTEGKVQGIDLDVTRAGDVEDIVRDFRPTAVVHLAGISSVLAGRGHVRRAWEVNLFGTMNLAEAVMLHAPEARFVFAGSSESTAEALMQH